MLLHSSWHLNAGHDGGRDIENANWESIAGASVTARAYLRVDQSRVGGCGTANGGRGRDGVG